MGKKSTPAAPAAPDPVATTQAQAQANQQAAVAQANLNRIDQYTPQGSITYAQTGTNADGTPKYAQTQTYSPEQQALYDQQNQVAQSLGSLAQNNITRVQDAQSKPFSFDGMTPLQSNIGAANVQMNVQSPSNPVQTGYNNGGGVQSTFGTGGPLTTNVTGGQIQNNIANAGNVQSGLNFGGLNNISTDFSGDVNTARNNAYAYAASRLDPQFAQQESDMRARLANSGISENSAAFRREMDNFGRTRNDAYNQAGYASYQAGLQAQQQGYGQSLATRQQGANEVSTAGNFANNAQGQVFGQNAAQLAAYNNAQQQGFTQGQQNAVLNNSAQGQQYQQNLGAAQFGNDAQQQQNTQNMQQAAFGNAANDQQYQQNLANTGIWNAGQAQQFGQAAQNAALNNQVRGQQIDEASYLRNLPLNEIAALLGTGGGVQNPTFANVSQVGVAAPDYQGAVYANYNAANQQYQAAQQARSQGLGSIFGLAGSLGSAAIMSDRRLKENIKRIGTLANGLSTYAYNYIGDAAQQFGVMAQDALGIVPEAVGTAANGYMYVDYSKVWNGR